MSCNCFIKLILISTNVVFLIFGLALIGMGSVAKIAMGEYWNSLSHWNLVAPVFVIAVGVLLASASIIGLVAVCTKKRCLLALFGGILICMLILQFSVAVLGFCTRSKIDKGAAIVLKKSLSKAYDGNDSNVYTKIFDKVQKELKCCGVIDGSEYRTMIKTIPKSCCDNEAVCTELKSYKQGCAVAIKDVVGENFLSLAIAEVVFCLASIGQISLVFLLFSRLKGYSYV